jgi:2',3'-cyclic-nucleotide 2'-phosphodiesterase (5'-nucleotidase family)
MRKTSYLFVLVALLFAECKTAGPPANTTLHYSDYKIGPTLQKDTSLSNLLRPYSDSLHRSMGVVIGFSTAAMYKKLPESAIGNFMADCMRTMAEKKFSRRVDAAIVNYGGIRSYIPEGNVTLEKVYELMPFDNLIVLQEIKGSILKQLLDHIATKEGWPVSGITMAIKNKQATNITVSGKPLDENATYTIANNDYVANGGDDCTMLRNIPQVNKGYLYRDAIIGYIQDLTKQGKPVKAQIENRVINAN